MKYPSLLRYTLAGISLLSAGLYSCSNSKPNETTKLEPVKIILDTDIGPDYDDVGAVAVLHALADSGYAEPLAIVGSNAHPLVAPTIQILNNYFGRPNLPIATPKGENVPREAAVQGWPELLVQKYPHTLKSSDEAGDAVQLYRKLLASQPDTSVTVVTVGFLTNLKHLLDTQPDEFSDLNGKDLITKKVKRLVSMAGLFPEGREYNVMIDSLASEKVFTQWPTEIIFSGFEIGRDIITGKPLTQNESLQNSPVKDAYAKAMTHYPSDSAGRNSWDQTAVLAAVKGASPYWGLHRGHFVPKGGNNAWKDDPNGPHAYLTVQMPVAEVTSIIENLMMHTKK